MGRCGEIESGGILNIPMEAVYTAPHELYFKPSDNQFKESKLGVSWKKAEKSKPVILSCEGMNPSVAPVHINVSDYIMILNDRHITVY